ncbi:ABC transporter substrate-binding protein, partial [Oleiphilus sp. HI0117]
MNNITKKASNAHVQILPSIALRVARGTSTVSLFFLLYLSMLIGSTSAYADEHLSPSLKNVSIQLKWKHQFQFAGFYAALENGYYQDAGYNVEIRAAGPDINPITEVLEGKADYGIANAELVLYHLNGNPLVALAAIIQHSPIVLMTLKKNN